MIIQNNCEKNTHQLSAVSAEREQLEDLLEVLLLGEDGARQGALVGLFLLRLLDRGSRSARLRAQYGVCTTNWISA